MVSIFIIQLQMKSVLINISGLTYQNLLKILFLPTLTGCNPTPEVF